MSNPPDSNKSAVPQAEGMQPATEIIDLNADEDDPTSLASYVRRKAGGITLQNRELHADDKAIIIAIGGSAFCAGLFGFYEGHPILGVILTLGGLLVMAPVSPFIRERLPTVRRQALWAVAIVTWLFLAANIGLSVYFGPSQLPADQHPQQAVSPSVSRGEMTVTRGAPNSVIIAGLQAQITALKQERDTKNATISDLNARLAQATSNGQASSAPSQIANQGPINWNLDGQFLVGNAGGIGGATISSILLQGTSKESTGIKEADAISSLTGHQQEFVANAGYRGYYPVDKVDIPPQARVWLELLFKPPLSIKDFQDQWGKLAVTIVYNDGTKYEHQFDEDYVTRKIKEQFPDAFGPHVTPRDQK